MNDPSSSKDSVLAVLGPAGSHSHQAADSLCRTLDWSPELVCAGTLHQLLQRHEGWVLLPLENALEGAVRDVQLRLGSGEYPLAPQLSFRTPVVHSLIRSPQAQEPVRRVVSHPQALAQCEARLRHLLGEEYEAVPAASTSEAVRALRHADETTAALGTEMAARLYGMEVVASDMADMVGNQTRFLLCGPPLPSLPQAPAKTSLCLGLQDRPGALVDLLLVFKAYGINMSRIESRPSRQRFGDYLFYIDVENDLHQPAFDKARLYLEADTTSLWISPAYGELGVL